AANVKVVDSQHITATTSPHGPGPADVVISDGGQTIWLTGAFTFVPFGTSPSTSLESALAQDFQQVFRAPINHPAFFDNSTCGGNVTSTAYFKQSGTSSTLMYLTTSADGKTVLNHLQRTTVTPAGAFRVLVVLVGYAETVNQSSAALFAAAQAQINQDHAG